MEKSIPLFLRPRQQMEWTIIAITEHAQARVTTVIVVWTILGKIGHNIIITMITTALRMLPWLTQLIKVFKALLQPRLLLCLPQM